MKNLPSENRLPKSYQLVLPVTYLLIDTVIYVSLFVCLPTCFAGIFSVCVCFVFCIFPLFLLTPPPPVSLKLT